MNPYQELPAHHFWRSQISTPNLSEIDYDTGRKFTFDISADNFATAGSCFSQHFGREVARRGGRLPHSLTHDYKKRARGPLWSPRRRSAPLPGP